MIGFLRGVVWEPGHSENAAEYCTTMVQRHVLAWSEGSRARFSDTHLLWRGVNLWRGDLSPLGCAAALKLQPVYVWTIELPALGLLRSPTGINPLATGNPTTTNNSFSTDRSPDHRETLFPCPDRETQSNASGHDRPVPIISPPPTPTTV
jgi:hypothetical protein